MTVYVGEQLAAQAPYFGVWSATATAYTFQWQDSLNGSTLNGNLSGETRSDVIAAGGEEGRWLRYYVVASNAGGDSDPAFSAWVGPVEVFVAPADGETGPNRSLLIGAAT